MRSGELEQFRLRGRQTIDLNTVLLPTLDQAGSI